MKMAKDSGQRGDCWQFGGAWSGNTLRHSLVGSSVPRPGTTSISNSAAMGEREIGRLVGLDIVEHLAEYLGSLGISEQNLSFIFILLLRRNKYNHVTVFFSCWPVCRPVA